MKGTVEHSRVWPHFSKRAQNKLQIQCSCHRNRTPTNLMSRGDWGGGGQFAHVHGKREDVEIIILLWSIITIAPSSSYHWFSSLSNSLSRFCMANMWLWVYILVVILMKTCQKIKIEAVKSSGVSRQLFNWVQVIESNRTGGCIKLVEVYYSIHVVLLIV